MSKKSTATKQNLESKPLEVEVIIPKEVLERESSFKGIYTDGKLKYDFGSELPEKVKEEIKDIIETSKTDELVMFNPLLVSLAELQSFKELVYDPEKKDSDRDYIDSDKKIGSFNSTVKKTSDLMKKDATEYVKKVNSVRDLLLAEAQTTREILKENFKEYLDEKERKKREAEDKKNAAILAQNAELAKINEEQSLKLKNQQKESKKLAVQGEIGKIVFSATSGISVLNLEGLEKLKKEIESNSFTKILTPEEKEEFGFTDDELFELNNEFNNAVSTSLKTISIAVDKIKSDEQVNSLKTENEVIKAQQPSSLLSGKNDMPFSSANQIPVPENLASDKDKIERLASILEVFNNQIGTYNSEIGEISFEDEGLQKIHDIIFKKSFPQIVEWGEKLVNWTNTKKDAYIEHINNHKQTVN